MQQHELEQFERLFGDYPGAPPGEPSGQDERAIKAAIKAHRDARRSRHDYCRLVSKQSLQRASWSGYAKGAESRRSPPAGRMMGLFAAA